MRWTYITIACLALCLRGSECEKPRVLSNPAAITPTYISIQRYAPDIPSHATVDHLDDLEDVGDRQSYIRQNRLTIDDVVKIANNHNIVLFGELHPPSTRHHEKALELLSRVDKRDVAYAHEDFSVDNKDVCRRYMLGDDTVRDVIAQSGWFGQDLADRLHLARSYGMPILVTDLGRKEKMKLGQPGFNLTVIAVRNAFIAQSIAYARRQGFRVYGTFGDIHVQPWAIPAHLKQDTVLVITGASFSRRVMDSALQVSGGQEIFFKRDNHIMYVVPTIDYDGRYGKK